ncbi:phosphoglucosamine mutase [Hydrogenophilus thiooxidans]|uniref:phosphoglucosamine mutase n=1 Tax=Hydrogenophilus thiooxidans TaxID=2820326 RepID=UPI001C237E4D|nr:phosphoglucosamine mutase [Hydrogenophilus thiooxidans]
MARWFGTDGIRGRIGDPHLAPDFVVRLGFAAGKVLARAHTGLRRPTVVIGKDTRVSGYLLEAALEAGLASSGVDVLLTGPLPTPGIAYLTRAMRLDAGIVVSASHNPYYDNGIKFFSAAGTKLDDALEVQIEEWLEAPVESVTADALGKAKRIDDASGRYIEFCKNTFPADLTLDGWHLVLDCAHGATYQVAPHVFHELGAKTTVIGAEPDGFNINRAVGATHPETLQHAVEMHQADLGIAFDGDGDRVVMVDREGRLYDGDALLFAIVRDRLAAGVSVPGVVGTVMTNLGLERALGAYGVPLERTAVGDRFVAERLRKRGWCYGGENSGHLLCLDKHTTGDGIISALQVLAALVRYETTLAEWTAPLQTYPQRLRNVVWPKGEDWQAHGALRDAVALAQSQLADHGRILIRPSGTEPLLRIMVEGEEAAVVDAIVEALAETAERVAQQVRR